MKIDSDIENIVDKVMDDDFITKDEIICLLKKDYHSLADGIVAWVFEGKRVFDANGKTKRVHVYGKKWNYLPDSYESVMFGFVKGDRIWKIQKKGWSDSETGLEC